MATTKERERSPLNCIPSSDAVRRRLERVIEEARQLRILLRTASQIEQSGVEAKAGGKARD